MPPARRMLRRRRARGPWGIPRRHRDGAMAIQWQAHDGIPRPIVRGASPRGWHGQDNENAGTTRGVGGASTSKDLPQRGRE